MSDKTEIALIPSQLCTELLFEPQMGTLSSIGSPRIYVQRDHDSVGAMAQGVLDKAADKFALVAHGMGCFVAFEILRRAPERVTKLVMMSGLAPADTPKQTVRREGYLRLVEEGKFDGIIEERIPMLVNPARVNDDSVTRILRQMARDTGPDVFQRQQRAIMARADSRPTLGTISCPVLLMFGRQDGISTLDHQNEMLNAIADARLEILEECGHMMSLERPEKVNAVLTDFFS